MTALLRPADWGEGSPARAALLELSLHLPSHEIRDADHRIVEAWMTGYARVLAAVPLDLLQDACRTALSMQPALTRFPAPAKLLEIVHARRYFSLRKTRLALVQKLAQQPREADKREPLTAEQEAEAEARVAGFMSARRNRPAPDDPLADALDDMEGAP